MVVIAVTFRPVLGSAPDIAEGTRSEVKLAGYITPEHLSHMAGASIPMKTHTDLSMRISAPAAQPRVRRLRIVPDELAFNLISEGESYLAVNINISRSDWQMIAHFWVILVPA